MDAHVDTPLSAVKSVNGPLIIYLFNICDMTALHMDRASPTGVSVVLGARAPNVTSLRRAATTSGVNTAGLALTALVPVVPASRELFAK